jgi:hypothetical protein
VNPIAIPLLLGDFCNKSFFFSFFIKNKKRWLHNGGISKIGAIKHRIFEMIGPELVNMILGTTDTEICLLFQKLLINFDKDLPYRWCSLHASFTPKK